MCEQVEGGEIELNPVPRQISTFPVLRIFCPSSGVRDFFRCFESEIEIDRMRQSRSWCAGTTKWVHVPACALRNFPMRYAVPRRRRVPVNTAAFSRVREPTSTNPQMSSRFLERLRTSNSLRGSDTITRCGRARGCGCCNRQRVARARRANPAPRTQPNAAYRAFERRRRRRRRYFRDALHAGFHVRFQARTAVTTR